MGMAKNLAEAHYKPVCCQPRCTVRLTGSPFDLICEAPNKTFRCSALLSIEIGWKEASSVKAYISRTTPTDVHAIIVSFATSTTNFYYLTSKLFYLVVTNHG